MPKKNEKKETVHVYGEYQLNRYELDAIAKETALLVQQITNLQEEKKNTLANISNQIKTLESELQHKAQCTREGLEWRTMECQVEFDLLTNTKRYYWIHDGRLVKQEPMTPQEIAEENQLSLSWDILEGTGDIGVDFPPAENGYHIEENGNTGENSENSESGEDDLTTGNTDSSEDSIL